MDRYELTAQTLQTNLSNHGYDGPVELLWCDNGSKDPRFASLFEAYKPVHLRANKRNEGCARGFNQLILRASGDYMVLMGNDVLMPNGWLKEMVSYAEFVPKSGLIGIRCTAEIPALTFKHGCYAHFLDDKCDKVFGVTLFSRQLVEEIGGFCEDFDVYGLEDSNLNDRANAAGFVSLYVPATHFVSTHIGGDCGDQTEYRKNKDASLERNLAVFWRYREQYRSGERPLKEPLPELKEPLS